MPIPSNISEVKRKVKDQLKEQENSVATKPEKEDVLSGQELRSTPFDQGKFGAVLEDIIASFKSQKKHLECTVLKQPYQVNGSKINFFLNGELQEHLFVKLKPELMGIVKKKLQNDLVELDFEVKEDAVSEEKKLYTSTDKLAYLTKKSPALKELQKRFGLETDF
ncbi:DNA polymerase III subunit gamma/tau [Echinicola sp. CAU 1574]|uniref:DNA polymerase III subunit gamma/tau n=1 Tax=Echinicola arenosa TaxID=2774144 RepID=A0ABR9AQT8_9BACT|nr:DNA polymerase III subunit gamma/tau [Echinicola arenosa]MBD8491145.1 DNA polymerase III subunit gamma/tau [Echinicola arenosa]